MRPHEHQPINPVAEQEADGGHPGGLARWQPSVMRTEHRPQEYQGGEPEQTDESIEADAVDPEHQGPGDSEGHAPYAPDEAEPKPEE